MGAHLTRSMQGDYTSTTKTYDNAPWQSVGCDPLNWIDQGLRLVKSLPSSLSEYAQFLIFIHMANDIVKSLTEEKMELEEKIGRLSVFLDNKDNPASEAQRVLLRSQFGFMNLYSGVLALRIEDLQSRGKQKSFCYTRIDHKPHGGEACGLASI